MKYLLIAAAAVAVYYFREDIFGKKCKCGQQNAGPNSISGPDPIAHL